jgi:glucose-1-phosphate cytidylyltransferase
LENDKKKLLPEIPVVILCGGQGTRMRAVSEELPKPMVDVGGKPILWHIMKSYSHYGVKRFILALGYKGDRIVDYFENYYKHTHDYTMRVMHEEPQRYPISSKDEDSDIDEWEITFAYTGEYTMTGGRIKRVEKYINTPSFFATYGDGISNVDIRKLYEFHCGHGRIATLTGVHLPTTFGVVETDAGGSVISFREKPVMPGLINGGFFVFNHEIFSLIKGDSTILEAEPFYQLVEQQEIRVWKHDGFWHCMDHYKDYSDLNKMWKENNAAWKVW